MKEIKINDTRDDTRELPVLALLALAMTGFICILTETIPAGLLTGISSGLNISPSVAGQMVTAYATGSLLAAIPLTILTRTWSRRSVLLATVCGFLLFNSLTALSDSVAIILCARFLAGSAAGLAWSLIAGYARRMVSASLQGRALTLAMSGTPVALSLGVPAGTWLGDLLGWRLTFAVMSGLSVVLMIWIILAVPDYPGQSLRQKIRLTSVLLIPGIRPILGVVLTWMIAHNILYTYVAPFLAQSGLSSDVDVVLLIFGLAAMVGIFITGRVIDSCSTSPAVIYPGIAVWGLTFGGAATLLQTALADTAGEYADIALSMNVVTWNSAIALGGLTGGFLLRNEGASVLPWVLVVLLIIALVIAFRARTHGFPSGNRPS